jgi:D-alanyl-D-alanine carboxypeptidase/D-alanyl-D-alanine-endopeptidase (penicillin-binding protein 4)
VNIATGKNNISYNIKSQIPNNKNEGLNIDDEIIFAGQMNPSSDDNYNLFAVSDPSLFLGTFFKEALNDQGIKFSGDIKRKKTPGNSKLLAMHTSQSLAESLIDYTKISNNLAHDSLIKAIAHYSNPNEKPASFEDGLKLVHKFLKEEVKIKTHNIITADGSGLSRYNLVTPSQMMAILMYASNQFLWGAEFIASLPIGGEDGTLGSRFVNNGLKGQIRAKTGSMSGVNNLVGFANIDKEKLAFVIMINGFVGSVSKYSLLQENILSSIYHNKNNKTLADR